MAGGEAQLKYLDGDFDVIMPGAYVICAVTGKQIALENLRYWSVAQQSLCRCRCVRTSGTR